MESANVFGARNSFRNQASDNKKSESVCAAVIPLTAALRNNLAFVPKEQPTIAQRFNAGFKRASSKSRRDGRKENLRAACVLKM